MGLSLVYLLILLLTTHVHGWTPISPKTATTRATRNVWRSKSSALWQQSNDQQRDDEKRLTSDFVNIAGPALLQLAAEPLASLVDTAYLGRLGPAVLGGAGGSGQAASASRVSWEPGTGLQL